MKSVLRILAVSIALALPAAAQPCLNAAREVAPGLSPETRQLYEKNLEDAEAIHLERPNAADSILWLGRRTAYLGHYKNAIRIFSSGATLFKTDARFYRHRGHRYITIRCFDDAIRDLEKAAELIKGKPDEIEPDGIPNSKNIPTSTLQSNIWYHLGLAYYLKGDFKQALRAYDEAEKVSKNPDMLVATKHWRYMTLRRLGERDKASKIVDGISPDLQLIENDDYYKLIKLYKGIESGGKLLEEFESAPDGVSKASLGYGLGNRYLYHNKRSEAMDIFRKILAGKQWASFGYIAAEIDLARLMTDRDRSGKGRYLKSLMRTTS